MLQHGSKYFAHRPPPRYFWGFEKNEYCFGVENFVDIFLGSSQNWASFRVISMQFRVFFKVKDIFWVAKISNIFLVA